MDQKKAVATGLRTLLAALGLGALADGLLRGATPGINVALWVGTLAAVIAACARRQRGGWGRDARGLTAAAVLFALGFAWRDSPVLHSLDALALLACLGLAVPGMRRESRLGRADVTDYARGIARTAVQAAFGGFGLVFRDIPWRDLPRGGPVTRRLASVSVGLLVALPPLLIFGALFAAADPVFSHLLHVALDWNFADLTGHLLTTAVCALVIGGFLRALFRAAPAPEAARPTDRAWALGTVEVGVALGLLDLLFLLFVLVQLRFFFGGARTVQVTAGLTYAQYARGGFFELVAVAALVLPLLLALDGLHRESSPTGGRVFRALAGLQVALLFIIMASAVQRMRLYQAEYGLTELRLYVTAFMAWLALVFLWFGATVLRGRRDRFALGGLLTALAVIAALNALDPDAVIVRGNLALARAGRPFDMGYALSLSADAVPALRDGRAELPPTQAQAVATRLAAARTAGQTEDWRSWNWSRREARRAVM